LGPLWVSPILLGATYAVVVSERFNHAIVSLPGAGLMIMLGDEMSWMEVIASKAKQLLAPPVDPYLQEPALSRDSEVPAIKALAMMEQNDSSYLFVVDEGQ
jgi:hypothetical protein